MLSAAPMSPHTPEKSKSQNDNGSSFTHWHPEGLVPFSGVLVTLVPVVVERRTKRRREEEGKGEKEGKREEDGRRR